MVDLVLVVCFFSMLMVPCYLAMRTVRDNKISGARMAGVTSMAEEFDEVEGYAAPFESTVDRRALAIQRSREIYFRTGGRQPSVGYCPLTSAERGSEASYMGQM